MVYFYPICALLLLAISAFLFFRRFGFRFYWRGAPLSYTPCATCEGLGVVLLFNKKIIPIPPELRDRDPHTGDFMPPLANAQRCPRCHGIGHVWSISGHSTPPGTTLPNNPFRKN